LFRTACGFRPRSTRETVAALPGQDCLRFRVRKCEESPAWHYPRAPWREAARRDEWRQVRRPCVEARESFVAQACRGAWLARGLRPGSLHRGRTRIGVMLRISPLATPSRLGLSRATRAIACRRRRTAECNGQQLP